ncbi:MAG: class I adenylate-forming enzyme family protein, partial [Betaproteobacteria bacterium]
MHVRISNQPLDLAAYAGVWLAGGVVVPLHRSSPAGAVTHVLSKTRARFEWDRFLNVLSNAPPPARPILDGAALIVFTSGSSGMPKGAVLSHRAFIGKLEAIQSLLGFSETDRTMLVLNITFSFGIWVALLTLLHGGGVLARERFSASAFMRDLEETRATRVAVVPTMMRSLILDVPAGELEAQGRRLATAGALQKVLIGGETLGAGLGATVRALFRPAELIDIYGLTETSTCDFFLLHEDAERYAGCIGRPSPGVRYRIVGDDGELHISSPFLMNGYLDEPQLQPIQDGWLATGDLARERDPGVVEIVGRKKEL